MFHWILYPISILGFVFTLYGFYRNVRSILLKNKVLHTLGDFFFNYPLLLITTSFFILFFVGLIANNP